jgi:hypothetical protein
MAADLRLREIKIETSDRVDPIVVHIAFIEQVGTSVGGKMAHLQFL